MPRVSSSAFGCFTRCRPSQLRVSRAHCHHQKAPRLEDQTVAQSTHGLVFDCTLLPSERSPRQFSSQAPSLVSSLGSGASGRISSVRTTHSGRSAVSSRRGGSLFSSGGAFMVIDTIWRPLDLHGVLQNKPLGRPSCGALRWPETQAVRVVFQSSGTQRCVLRFPRRSVVFLHPLRWCFGGDAPGVLGVPVSTIPSVRKDCTQSQPHRVSHAS